IPKNTGRKTTENTGKRKEARGKGGRSRAMEREVRTGGRAGPRGISPCPSLLPPVPARESHPGQI
ncbi:MAG: hypothetical protein MJ006_03450, partial [Methanocorpusculum sp.]|nr:hypothetical protein [Methanocorpusculum sp.]